MHLSSIVCIPLFWLLHFIFYIMQPVNKGGFILFFSIIKPLFFLFTPLQKLESMLKNMTMSNVVVWTLNKMFNILPPNISIILVVNLSLGVVRSFLLVLNYWQFTFSIVVLYCRVVCIFLCIYRRFYFFHFVNMVGELH
jgi:hypothetical protein